MPTTPRPNRRPTRAATGRTPRTVGEKTMAKGATAVARKEDENLPSTIGLADQFDSDAGKGRENVRASDMAIPFWIVLQKGSPECDKATNAYVPGAEQGMIINGVTKEILDGTTGLEVLPAHFEKVVIEWTPRESGGGLVAIHPADTSLLARATRNDKGQFVKEGSSNILVETAQHYSVRLLSDGSTESGVVAMASTQLKKSRQWNSLMAAAQMTRGDGTKFTPPTFARRYRLTTVPESNNKGSWYGWKIESLDWIKDAGQYQVAKALNEAAAKGEVTARPARADDGSEAQPETSTANKPY